MRRIVIPFVALLGLLLLGCAPKIDAPSEQAVISALDLQMVDAINSADFDRWLGFMTDDAVLMPPNEPAIVGKPGIQKWVSSVLTARRLHVAHHVTTVEVSRSGDLAYTSYAYEFILTDPAGKSITEKGKDLSIFKKQPDGSWKLARDMWSPDLGATDRTQTALPSPLKKTHRPGSANSQ